MSLMKKIIIIFVSITITSSIIFYFLGISIIDQASKGEFDRGPGRTSAVISRVNAEKNKIGAKAIEFSEYYQIKGKVEQVDNSIDTNEIINIEKKATNGPISNMIILNEYFEIEEILKEVDQVEKSELENLSTKTKKILEVTENKKSGYFSGIIRTNNYPYLVGAKSFRVENKEKYFLAIERMDKEFIGEIAKELGRIIDIVPEESLKDINQEEVRRVNLRNREFYCNPKDKFIDVYTELEGLDGFENRYYIKLSDDREVRMNAEYNVHMIIFTTIILTIIANWIIYLLIKKNVVNRILKINNAINEVHEGENSNYSLEDDEKGDEIAELNNDLNAMLRRLRTYSENLEYISRKDTLTELKNRYSINEYILRLTTERESFSIFFIDLDNFKVINDTLGHNIGDELLLKVSEGLKVITEKYDNLTVGRLGGDEFIIVRKGENSVDEIKLLAKEILKTVNKSYEFSSYVYEIKASMGISFYPEHSNKGVEVIQYADIAMYCSKRTGGNSYDIFNKNMLEPLKIEKKLKKAIEEEEFEMYLQPIYSINNDKIIGSEALIRWKVDGKIISPDKFIPLAKRTGDIVSIDNFIFETAVKMVKNLLMEGKENFYISINISKLFLKQENLIPFIKQKLREVSVESKYIKMEVAEDEIIDDFDYTIGLLEELRQIGIEIYLDDFGVGYSSFSHIKLLPIDVLKLDRSLLLDIENNKKSQEIVKTLINLAHNLNIEIICEGIETKEQVEILQKLNCDNIQGYFFGKPAEKEKFIEYL